MTACWNHLLATIVSGWSSRAQAPVRRHPDQRLQGRRRGHLRRGRLRPHRPDHLRRGDRGAGPRDVRDRQPALPAPLRVPARLGRGRPSGAAASASRPCFTFEDGGVQIERLRRRRDAGDGGLRHPRRRPRLRERDRADAIRTAPSTGRASRTCAPASRPARSTARSRAAAAATATRTRRPAGTGARGGAQRRRSRSRAPASDYGVVDRRRRRGRSTRPRRRACAGTLELRAPQPAPAARDWRKRSISTRQDEHGSRDHVLVVDRDARDDQAVLEDAEEEDAEERAEHRADAADEARPAEQHRGGGRELDPGVGVRRRGGEAAGLEEAGERGEARRRSRRPRCGSRRR